MNNLENDRLEDKYNEHQGYALYGFDVLDFSKKALAGEIAELNESLKRQRDTIEDLEIASIPEWSPEPVLPKVLKRIAIVWGLAAYTVAIILATAALAV